MLGAKARGKRPAARSSQVLPKMVAALTVMTAPEGKPAYRFDGDEFLPTPDDGKPLSKEDKLECLEAARKEFAENEQYEYAPICRDEIASLNGVKAKKRRMSPDKDPGGQSAHQRRYEGVSHMAGGLGWYLAGSRARTDPQFCFLRGGRERRLLSQLPGAGTRSGNLRASSSTPRQARLSLFHGSWRRRRSRRHR